MTICNMTIEGGGRAGMIAPDETTFEWVERPARRARGLRGRGRAVARALHRGRRDVRQGDRRRRVRAVAAGHLGHDARDGRAGHRRGAAARGRGPRARAQVHGPRAGHADLGHQARPRLHRLVHELADRRPARRRRGHQGQQGPPGHPRDGRPGVAAGEAAGRGRGPRRGVQVGRLRLALAPAARCAWA